MPLHTYKIDKAPQFVSYFKPVLEVIREFGGIATPRQVYDEIAKKYDVPVEFLALKNKKGTSTFENRVAWARFYLNKAGVLYAPKRGEWALTQLGSTIEMTEDKAVRIFKDTHTMFREDEDAENAPETTQNPDAVNYWFVGASWGSDDQLDRFISEGIWQNGYDDKFRDLVRQMKVGDRIAVKSTFTQKHNVPFENRGRTVSAMRIKAIGTITATREDEQTVEVNWQPVEPARDWYFYTYRTTVSRARYEDDDLARKLISFTFDGQQQDYSYFLSHNHWGSRYAADIDPLSVEEEEAEAIAEQDQPPFDDYDIEDIIADGAFLSADKLQAILNTLIKKKNLILQGPPGTGKTWLAKRLAMALIGRKSPSHSQLRAMQFHPSLSYEDFVRGYRPSGDGKLTLTDGIFLQMIEVARAEPDIPHVLVIEEINRGNPAQIFGEMLTLLEHTKRSRADAMELAYRKVAGEKVHVPDNLYLIGTMNVADRSLALVDLALRRRFAYVMLEPSLNDAWENWSCERGLRREEAALIRQRMCELNNLIAQDRSLGAQFCIGHSYVTPPKDGLIDGKDWFAEAIETEIGPLLEEYWFDAPDRVREAKAALKGGF